MEDAERSFLAETGDHARSSGLAGNVTNPRLPTSWPLGGTVTKYCFTCYRSNIGENLPNLPVIVTRRVSRYIVLIACGAVSSSVENIIL